MRVLAVILLLVYALPLRATMTVGSCPEVFEGQVKAISPELGPEEAFSKQRVIFVNAQTLKGDVSEQVSIDMLKSGPFEIEVGKDYRVHLRKGKLCWIERI